MQFTAFPNPATDFVCLKVDASTEFIAGSLKVESLKYTINELSGKVLQTGILLKETERINFSIYAQGTYILTVQQNNQLVKSFQIIKN